MKNLKSSVLGGKNFDLREGRFCYKEQYNWHKEVGSVSDEKQEARTKFYQKLERLSGEVNREALQGLNMEPQEIKKGFYLYDCLAAGLKNKKRVRQVLATLSESGFNVDKFKRGDRVEIRNGVFIVNRAPSVDLSTCRVMDSKVASVSKAKAAPVVKEDAAPVVARASKKKQAPGPYQVVVPAQKSKAKPVPELVVSPSALTAAQHEALNTGHRDPSVKEVLCKNDPDLLKVMDRLERGDKQIAESDYNIIMARLKARNEVLAHKTARMEDLQDIVGELQDGGLFEGGVIGMLIALSKEAVGADSPIEKAMRDKNFTPEQIAAMKQFVSNAETAGFNVEAMNSHFYHEKRLAHYFMFDLITGKLSLTYLRLPFLWRLDKGMRRDDMHKVLFPGHPPLVEIVQTELAQDKAVTHLHHRARLQTDILRNPEGDHRALKSRFKKQRNDIEAELKRRRVVIDKNHQIAWDESELLTDDSFTFLESVFRGRGEWAKVKAQRKILESQTSSDREKVESLRAILSIANVEYKVDFGVDAFGNHQEDRLFEFPGEIPSESSYHDDPVRSVVSYEPADREEYLATLPEQLFAIKNNGVWEIYAERIEEGLPDGEKIPVISIAEGKHRSRAIQMASVERGLNVDGRLVEKKYASRVEKLVNYINEKRTKHIRDRRIEPTFILPQSREAMLGLFRTSEASARGRYNQFQEVEYVTDYLDNYVEANDSLRLMDSFKGEEAYCMAAFSFLSMYRSSEKIKKDLGGNISFGTALDRYFSLQQRLERGGYKEDLAQMRIGAFQVLMEKSAFRKWLAGCNGKLGPNARNINELKVRGLFRMGTASKISSRFGLGPRIFYHLDYERNSSGGGGGSSVVTKTSAFDAGEDLLGK